ncbi:MAG: hypothetical protein HYZ75_17380 [Elusimicrobia bacterium]|nr:hypothetical protein [Elusimicrobiota bacterium]
MRVVAAVLSLILGASGASAAGRAVAPVVVPVAPGGGASLAAPVAPTLAPITPALTLAAPSAQPTLSAVAMPTPVAPNPAPLAAAAVPTAFAAPRAALNAVAQPQTPGNEPEKQTLLQTLSAPAADLSGGLGDASGAARSDFESRAQLGRSAGGAGAVETGGAQVRGRSLRLLQPAQAKPAPAAAKPAARPLDADGSRMSAVLREVSGRAAVEPRTLDFIPSPASLRAMSTLDTEVFLYRERGTGVWRLTAGEPDGVSGDFGDYDLGLHNHPTRRLGMYSAHSAYPSPTDLVTAAGKDARVFVVSEEGVVEWNSTVPFLDEPGRYLERDASDADQNEWLRRLHDGSFWRRLVMKLTFPSGYPTLAGSLGLAMELKPWKKVSQEWLESGTAPQSAQTWERRLAPALAEEAVLAAERVGGRALGAAERADVVRRTRVIAVGWAKTLVNEFGVMASYPDGVARPDRSIELTMKPLAGLPDPALYYRVLFAHEYTHRLQHEGDVTTRWGVEIPAVAVELVRAAELVGVSALRKGAVPFITPNTLNGMDDGRGWAKSGRSNDAALYRRGALAGAALELAAQTGRMQDAWEFVRRVSSARKTESPAAVYADIVGR